jgi:hypothetical protein
MLKGAAARLEAVEQHLARAEMTEARKREETRAGCWVEEPGARRRIEELERGDAIQDETLSDLLSAHELLHSLYRRLERRVRALERQASDPSR